MIIRLNKTNLFFALASIIIPITVYTTSLVLEIPKQIGLTFRYGFLSLLLPAFFLVWFCFSRAGRAGTILSISAVFLMFALPLSGLWNSGIGEKFLVVGLLPWSDANAHYNGARALLEGASLNGIPARRPLFSALFSVLLGLSGQNLQISLALVTALAALSCFFAAREFQKSHGPLASTLFLLIIHLFFRRFIGMTLTENLGIALGALGFAFLWRGTGQGKISPILGGVFLTSLALNARAGAFFILPALVIWAGWFFRSKFRFSILSSTLVCITIIAGFLTNLILTKIITVPSNQPFSNFAHTFYGLAVGGKGWDQIFWDHPELRNVPDDEFNRVVYSLGFEEIKNNPSGLIIGAQKSFSDFFTISDISVFGYIGGDNPEVRIIANLFLYTCCIICLLGWFFNRQDRFALLVLIACGGILLSVPFAPPYDAEEMRAYAATIPFMAVLPIIGLHNGLSKFRIAKQMPYPTGETPFLNIFSVILVLITVLGGIAIKYLSIAPTYNDLGCPQGQEAMYIRYSPGSYLNVLQSGENRQTHLPEITWDRYVKTVHDTLNSRLIDDFIKIPAPVTIINGLDLKTYRQIWVYADSRLLPNPPAVLGICGKWGHEDPEKWFIQSFYPVTITPMK